MLFVHTTTVLLLLLSSSSCMEKQHELTVYVCNGHFKRRRRLQLLILLLLFDWLTDWLSYILQGTGMVCLWVNHRSTSQWLKWSCGLARPLVRLRISSAKPKLSTTGRTAVTLNIDEPSRNSSLTTRPLRRPMTAYILPSDNKRIQNDTHHEKVLTHTHHHHHHHHILFMNQQLYTIVNKRKHSKITSCQLNLTYGTEQKINK